MMRTYPAPIATLLGLTHVAVAQVSGNGWAVMVWEPQGKPQMLGRPSVKFLAVANAKRFVDETPASILELPEGAQ